MDFLHYNLSELTLEELEKLIEHHNSVYWEQGTQEIKADEGKNNRKKWLVQIVGQQIIERRPGNQRKCKINSCNQAGAENVNGKQSFVFFEVAEKNPDRGFCLKIFGGHTFPPC